MDREPLIFAGLLAFTILAISGCALIVCHWGHIEAMAKINAQSHPLPAEAQK